MTRALIVDDKEENLYYLEALLTGNGYSVMTARHGAEALIVARQIAPDVIISDLLMPVMDGYTLLRHWKADALLKAIPFIVYTATYTEPEDAQLALNLGADAFILKPTEPEDFLTRLHEVQNRAAATPTTVISNENVLLQNYSETLIRKLEEKTLQLEATNRELQQDILERRRIDDKLRASEDAQRQLAKTQMAILNALPAHIALIDVKGEIISVNESWRRFGSANFLGGDEFGVGQNYLEICEQSSGDCSDEALAVARGIRQVLNGEKREFSLEYPCHSPTEQHWFRLMVAPLHEDRQAGAVVMHINVTERRKAEETLQRSELEQRLLAQQLEVEHARLVAVQKVAKLGSWDTDIATLKVIWSEETHQIFETDPATFQPTHAGFLDLVHPEDWEEVDAAFLHSQTLHEAQEIQHRLLLPSGKIKFVTERWQVFFDEQEKPLRALGTIQDITERKLAEVELRRTTDLLWAVADGIPDAVFVKDINGRYLLFNQGASRLVGKPVEEVIGQDDTTIFGPEEAREVIANDREVIASGEARTSEEVLTAAGVTRTYLATKAPYRDESGRTIGTIGISRDITERKQAENKIREQATLLDKAQDAILVRDLDHHILYWNQSAERLYGWNAEEIIGHSIKELLYQDPTFFMAATNATLQHGEWFGEIQQFTRDGRALTIEGRWTLVRDDAGQPKSILAINTDITERKKLEQQFLRTQRMESIGTLAGGIAHDLNNVLAPILMSIDLLRLQERDAMRLDVLKTIEGSAKRGADMVAQVLSFARGMEGRQVEVQPGHLLREIERIANDTFLKSIRVTCDIPAGLWTVKGDPTQLHQVLINLCVNARDAMPNGGTLTLAVSNRMLDDQYAGMNPEAKSGPHVCFLVGDSGTGMTPEVVERIFEPFFTTKELGNGTGLGLSTTSAIIKSHGGFIQVQSDLGVGTEFRVFFPALSCEVSTDVGQSEKTNLTPGNGELVLVIDDEAAVREITRQTLEVYGYNVLLASDGAEGVTLYAGQKDSIAVVITDMMMPLMDGPTTIHVLLKINPQVRIIAASGMNTEAMVAKAIRAGVQHFIPKPYSAETLLDTLRQVLGT